jgi:uncharacterized protein with GYD domain
MATYLMFGTYTPESLKAASAKRTEDAIALIRQHGGEYKAGYALLGETDLVVMLDLPDTQRALQVSAGLTRLLGIRFRIVPAVSMDEFDRLLA